MRRLRPLVLTLVLSTVVGFSGKALASSVPESAGRFAQQISAGATQDHNLPMLSVIGMGVLTGGLLSAMRTRPGK